MKIRVVFGAGVVLVLAGLFLLHHGSLRQRAFKPEVAAVAAVPGGGVPGAPAIPGLTNLARSREFDPAVNPYAAALREPGKAKRAWDRQFMQEHANAASGESIRFELTGGVQAAGTIRITQYRDGELTYLSGELSEPSRGKFFFVTPPSGGKAGVAAGVVEFDASAVAYRIEPTGPNGEPELWQRRLDEVVCQSMPLLEQPFAEPTANIPPLRPDAVPDYTPAYNSNIVSLQSYPGASGVLLLDFFGGYTPSWGGVTYPRPNVSNADIKDLWKRVAEDFMPFNINVTTDIRVYQNAPAASRQKCVFSPSISAMPNGAAGVAYIGSWNWGSDTVCWSIYTTGKAGAEVGAHEPGHTLGLGHQGTSTQGYYGGQGSGPTGWAPTMGVGYYQPVSSWAKGEYLDANNHEDELNMITTQNNNVAYRPDDTGATLATSRYLEVYPGNTAFAEGVIERTGDADAFQFTTGGGTVSLTASPVGDWATLAVMALLADSTDTVIASNNPQNVLTAAINTNLPAGTYTFRVVGAGRNSPLTNGFSSYASLGYYSITGSVAAARLPTRLSVAEHSPLGTLVGAVPATVTTNPLTYVIVSGNTGNTFSIDNSGVVRVVNNSLLDYNRLATNTMLAVQFELLVNINNLANPALTELKRRVVIAVLDVNDAPVVTGFTNSVVEHTLVGTTLGTVGVRDPDFAETLSFSLVSGDTNGVFAVSPSGVVSVAGDLNASVQNVYNLAIAVNDNVPGNALSGTGYVRINVVSNTSPFQPGTISYALYDNIGSGQLVSDLTSNARWPRDPSSELQMPTFEGINNRADSYGAAMRGYLVPPQTGLYTFYIATDDNGELWFSTTTNTATISRIAYISGANNYASPQQWNKFSSQQSSPVILVAGQAYYIEARMKEGGGGDNLAVGWKGAVTGNQTNVIPGTYLAPYFMNYAPHASSFTSTVHQGAFTGTPIGTITVTDVNTNDGHNFTITAGNDLGLFWIDANSGTIHVTDQDTLSAAAAGTYILQVNVTDTGSPPLSTTATATINLVASDAISATSIRRELWHNIGGGTAVSDLTNNPAYPARPDALEVLSQFASAVDVADNYGSRIRAYLTPTNSGVYRFFISSDDNSALFLGLDGTPTSATRVAYVPGYTSANTWTTYSQQASALFGLVAGQRYYLEALQKEGGGGDHVEVAWAGPGILNTNGAAGTNIIDGSFLTPFDLNYPPVINSQTLPVISSIANGTAAGRVQAVDSPLDMLTFQLVDGNTNNMFALDPASGILTVVDNTLIANGTLTSFPLTIAVQDNGYGGLFPANSAVGTVTVTVQSPGGPLVWSGAGPTNAWSDPGNWGGAAPAAGARLIFGAPSQQANLNDSIPSLNWVLFTNSGFTASGSAISLQSGITNSGDNVWNVPATLTAAQTWRNSSGTFAAAGPVANSGFALGIVANGDFRLSGSISGAGGISKSGTARLLMQGNHPYTGATVLSATGGTNTSLEVNGVNDLNIGNSDLTLSGRMDLGSHNATIGALNGNGLIFAADSTRTLTVGANDHSGTFSGVLQNSLSGSAVVLNLVKVGAGSQTLSGANTFSGVLGVSAGTLYASGANALGAATGNTIVSSGATLALSGNLSFGSRPLTLNGAGVTNSGALRNDVGINSFNGAISLGGPATIRAAAGSLNLGGAWNLGGKTISFDVSPSGLITVSSAISGGGGLQKLGPGLLRLNAANGYPGLTSISNGTLALGVAGSLAAGSGISIASGAMLDVSSQAGGWALGAAQTLSGSGTVNGNCATFGTLTPGPGIGTLTVNGNLSLAGVTVVEISKQNGVLTNDALSCSGTLTLGGSLTVTSPGGDALVPGDSFRLFTAGSFGVGSFSNLYLPGLPADRIWDTSTLGVDGLLKVIPVEPASPPTLSAGWAGGVLTLSWPTTYYSFVLQGQTNPLTLGLGTNWFAVPGVSNNTIALPLDPNIGSSFYRLSKP